jgi:hypothetical protein
VLTHWEEFMSRELSDSEVAALSSGSHQWQEPPPEEGHPIEGLWKRAR